MNSTLRIVCMILLSTASSIAQCTVIIPSGTEVVYADTTIDCSFIPGNHFLVCPGTSLTMIGNSTCVLHFYLESSAVVSFKDSIPGAPYGFFSFFLKDHAVLDYNDGSPGSFGYIDTLVYEPTSILTDTGSSFHVIQICQPVVFDYSQLPSGMPCGTSITKGELISDFSISPIPFSNSMEIDISNLRDGTSLRIYNVLGEEVEIFELQNSGKQKLLMKNNWSGTGYIQIINDGIVTGRKMIVRYR